MADHEMWVPAIDLKDVDKDVNKCGGWLSDQHLNAANQPLSKQFPHLQGLQNTLLSQNGGFTPITSDGK